MKIYKFYSKPPEDIGLDSINMMDTHPLIAFTKDKDIRDMYVLTRNPNSFYEIVTKVDKKTYTKYANAYNGCKLDVYEYSIPSYSATSSPSMSYINVVTSWFEREIVSSISDEFISYVMENSVNYNTIFPFMLKSKYVNAFNKLLIIDFWKLFANVDSYTNCMRDNEIELCDYSIPDIICNEFKILINEYGYYFMD